MTRSIAVASMPAACSARRAASSARSLEPTSGAAKWRARMPVRSTIHWSDVSTPVGRQLGREGVVGEALRRQEAAGAGDARIDSGHGFMQRA
jgi:hypothetical protein